jgi:putative membrane protein
MKKILLPALAIATLIGFGCKGSDEKDSVEMAKEQNQVLDSSRNGETYGTDDEFLVEAASGGMMEVQLGQLAATNASSAQVKEFGKMMADDHSKANDELTTIARLKNIAIPSVPGDKHQEHINKMKEKRGEEFDKDYMDLMVEDHEEDIRKFERAAEKATDPDVKAFASKTVPVLRKHLEHAKSVKDGLKK